MRVLGDDEIRARLPADRVVAVLTALLHAQAEGDFRAPARAVIPLTHPERLTVTAGALGDQWYGYRAYAGVGAQGDEQVTVVHDGASGAVLSMAVSALLGPMRCGGMTAVAVDALTPPGPVDVTLVGAGQQAYHQLWALRAVRTLRRVRVVGRSPGSAARFVEEVRSRLGLDAAEATPPDLDADLVVLATSSPTPVLDPERIRPGQLVVTVGPKQVGRAEYSPALAAAADLVVTDSLAQLRGYDPPHVLADQADEIVELSSLLATSRADHGDELGLGAAARARALFCNVGLAGAEAALLQFLL